MGMSDTNGDVELEAISLRPPADVNANAYNEAEETSSPVQLHNGLPIPVQPPRVDCNNNPLRKILVVGATGRQGGAVIKALSSFAAPPPHRAHDSTTSASSSISSSSTKLPSSLSSEFEILALTRDPQSHRSQFLATTVPNLTLVHGNPSNPAAIFAAHPDIYGIFCMTVPPSSPSSSLLTTSTSSSSTSPDSEEAQSLRLIDFAITLSVQHFILSSIDRGGQQLSSKPQPGVGILHFSAKCRIENYLKTQIRERKSPMQYTLLRPVSFMDNLSPSVASLTFTSLWLTLSPKPLQLVSIHDVGVWAARALRDPDEFHMREISLAGDELTLEQARRVFKQHMGSELPETFSWVGKGLQWAGSELGLMFQWLKWVGHGADVQALREEDPRLQDLGIWLVESSKFFRE